MCQLNVTYELLRCSVFKDKGNVKPLGPYCNKCFWGIPHTLWRIQLNFCVVQLTSIQVKTYWLEKYVKNASSINWQCWHILRALWTFNGSNSSCICHSALVKTSSRKFSRSYEAYRSFVCICSHQPNFIVACWHASE